MIEEDTGQQPLESMRVRTHGLGNSDADLCPVLKAAVTDRATHSSVGMSIA